MNDIDEIIRRLDLWIKVWAYHDADERNKATKDLQKAITALQEMQQHIAELENDNQELANAIEETDKLNSERIAELEKGYQLQKSNAGGAYEQIKRLDAALKEISLGVVAPMDFAKKAREEK